MILLSISDIPLDIVGDFASYFLFFLNIDPTSILKCVDSKVRR